jgi:membrane protein CcdC involved in cytochrome C biogenesis
MFLSAFFSTGRIIFILFFVIAFTSVLVWSYKKDIKNHERYYKNAGKTVAIYGGIIIAIFVALRIIFGN